MELQVAITDLKVSYKGVFDFCKYFIRKEDVSCARVHDALVVVELRGEEGRRRGQGKGDGRRKEGRGRREGGRREEGGREEGGRRREEGGGKREEEGGRREEGGGRRVMEVKTDGGSKEEWWERRGRKRERKVKM